jgi:hypothetical protein
MCWRVALDIPEGFATLLTAVATLVAGAFVIIGALIAWYSVQRQVKSTERMEKVRHDNESSAIEIGFIYELYVYSTALIEAASIWNLRASHAPQTAAVTDWFLTPEPLYYKANVGKMGYIRRQPAAGALIGFYTNLLELNEQAREALSGKRTVNATNQSIAARLQRMAANMSHALTGLNMDQKLPIQPEIKVELICGPDGKLLGESGDLPTDLHELLLRVGGQLT